MALLSSKIAPTGIATLVGTETLSNKTLTSPDINGGTIDGAVIGGSTPAAISATTGNFSGTVTATSFSGDGSGLTGISAGITTGKAIAMAIVFGG